MAFTAQTYFPTTVGGEGANNDQWLDADPGINDQTTDAVYSTSTVQRYILWKPGATNTASSTPDNTADNFGWNILRTNMNTTTDTPNLRVIPAGTWQFDCVQVAGTADTLAPANTYRIRPHVYRMNSTGGFSFLFSTEANVPSADVGVAEWLTTFSATAGEFTFGLDETLHVEYFSRGRGGGATGLLSQTYTLVVSAIVLVGTTRMIVPSPGIRTRYPRTFSAAAEAAVAMVRKTKKVLTASAEGVAALARRLTLFRTLTASAEGTTTVTKHIVTSAKNASAEVNAFLTKKISLGDNTFPAIRVEGVVTLVRKTLKPLTARAEGATSLTLFIRKSLTASAEVSATLSRRLQFARTLSASAEVKAKAWVTILFEQVPGSIQSVIRRVYNIWED